MGTLQACRLRWLYRRRARWEGKKGWWIVSLRCQCPHKLVTIDRQRNGNWLTRDGDKRLRGAAGYENPVDRLNIVIVIRRVQREMLIRQQLQVGMRHHSCVPVIRITTVHVGKRRLSEA